ncbi:hypothetical protein DFP77_106132 [Marinomonas foliarum]|uniref:Uncharacterized protein n=1 Tax=Marinomonas foliarum TaxID=491950 RepID=A0A369AD13_9GAMM|nr:hypothetical protein DFP77_106132 [Marinomonas foliarum]
MTIFFMGFDITFSGYYHVIIVCFCGYLIVNVLLFFSFPYFFYMLYDDFLVVRNN